MKLALGTVQFGLSYGVANSRGRVRAEEVGAIMRKAYVSGMDTLDTAISYGDSESVLGSQGVQSWKVITKLPMMPEGCADVFKWVEEEVCESLSRLRTDKLYGLLLHRPVDLIEEGGRELYEALKNLKLMGLVEKIGISIYGTHELDLLFEKYNFDLVQAPLNILDRSLVETGWADRLKTIGVEIHARSAFLQGLLLMESQNRPRKFQRWSEVWDVWEEWLEANGLLPVEACLRYLNSLDCVDRVVVGVDSILHLNQIIDAVSGKLSSLPSFSQLLDKRLINPATWDKLSG